MQQFMKSFLDPKKFAYDSPSMLETTQLMFYVQVKIWFKLFVAFISV